MGAIIEALGFNSWTFFFQAVNVLVILAALYFIFWKPVVKALNTREDKIQGNLREAASAREKAEELLASHRQMMTLAHREREEILKQAAEEGRTTRTELIAEAKEEAARILEQARLDLEREKTAALVDIRRQAADLILMAATRVLARTLTPGDQEHLVREALLEVEQIQ